MSAARIGRSWRLLVLDDDAPFRQRLAATLRTQGAPDDEEGLPSEVVVDEVDTIAAARRRIFRHAYDGWIFDVWVPDGSGLDLLEDARREGVRTSALIITGDTDVTLANRAQLLGGEIAYKPDVVANALVFVERLIGVRAPRGGSRLGRLESKAVVAGLSPRELDILRAIRRGLTRSQVAATLGLSENTVKTMLRRLLAKGVARNAGELIKRWSTPVQGMPILDPAALDGELPASSEIPGQTLDEAAMDRELAEAVLRGRDEEGESAPSDDGSPKGDGSPSDDGSPKDR
jgi:DNA-binding NarL/FixJ family response regulator